jgi:hypothetical protein
MNQKLEFKTEVDLSILGGVCQDSGSGRIFVKWQLSFEKNIDGLSDIKVIVPDQEVEADITYFNYDTDEQTQVREKLSIKNVSVTLYSFVYGISPTQLDKYCDRYEMYF